MSRVLIVEDDETIATVVEFALTGGRFVVDRAATAAEARLMIKTAEYELIILDWILPDSSGLEICKEYRFNGGTKPILVLTGKDQTKDKVQAFGTGADDFLCKPFDTEELMARVKALIRRSSGHTKMNLQVGEIELDPDRFSVFHKGQSISLLPREFSILRLLMENPDQYFNAERILTRIWPEGQAGSVESVRTHIKSLRKKLGNNDLIESTRNLGYRVKSS